MHILLGAMAGKGNTADVFDIGDNKVVKLFRAGYTRSGVEQEYENSKLLNQLDIPTAKCYEMITHEGRFGNVFDKVNGIALLDILFQTFDIKKYTRVLAFMHQKILFQKAPWATSCKSILQESISCAADLRKESKEKLLKILNALPDGDHL